MILSFLIIAKRPLEDNVNYLRIGLISALACGTATIISEPGQAEAAGRWRRIAPSECLPLSGANGAGSVSTSVDGSQRGGTHCGVSNIDFSGEEYNYGCESSPYLICPVPNDNVFPASEATTAMVTLTSNAHPSEAARICRSYYGSSGGYWHKCGAYATIPSSTRAGQTVELFPDKAPWDTHLGMPYVLVRVMDAALRGVYVAD